MDDNAPKENPPADFNKLDLTQLQGFSFGTQWTQEKPGAPDRRDREQGGERPRRDGPGGGAPDLGSVTDVISTHDLGGGDPLVILGYVLLFGSAPMVVGLTAAAARWSNRFGTFVGKYRVGLVALALAAYGGLLALLSAEGWPGAGVRLKAIGSVTTSISIEASIPRALVTTFRSG